MCVCVCLVPPQLNCHHHGDSGVSLIGLQDWCPTLSAPFQSFHRSLPTWVAIHGGFAGPAAVYVWGLSSSSGACIYISADMLPYFGVS